MAVKEIIIKQKGNIVFKKNINLNMKGEGIRSSKPKGGGSKVTYWVYSKPYMFPLRGFHKKKQAEKFYSTLIK